jgi:predicted nucleotidyltransferase
MQPQPTPRNIHIAQAKNNAYTLTIGSRGTVMLPNELHTKKVEIEAAADKYGATRIRIFGSVARGEESPNSDIDFLLNLPHGYDLFLQRLPLTEDLAKITGRKVDLVPENELNVHMRDYVLQEAAEI